MQCVCTLCACVCAGVCSGVCVCRLSKLELIKSETYSSLQCSGELWGGTNQSGGWGRLCTREEERVKYRNLLPALSISP